MIPEDRLSTESVPGGWLNPPEPLAWESSHWGPVHLNDPSQGLLVQLWAIRAKDNEIFLSAPNYPEQVFLTTASEVKQVSLAFDQNGQPHVAYVLDTGAAHFYWYDPLIPGYATLNLAAGTADPRITMDDAREFMNGANDVILAYVRAGSLYYRQQRDRYTVEKLLRTGVQRLYHVSMNNRLRLQFSYKGPGMPDPPFLADVVFDLCRKAGIPAQAIDVSELYTSIVHGIRIDSDSGLTEPLDQLRKVFFFDKAEYDRKIYFPKRGRDIVARIPYSDLVRGNPSSLKQERKGEKELAREVNVNHLDPDGGFAKNKQYAQRRSNLVNAQAKKNVDTQVVLTVDQAATVADTLLRIEWNELVEYKFATTIKWTELTTGDVIEVEDRGGTWHRMRIEEKNEDGTIGWECTQDAGQRTYGVARAGYSLPPPTSTTPGLVGPTQLEIVDVSPLRDQDDELGLYIAAAGAPNMAWTGYQLLVSVDGGLTYAEAFRSEQASTIGDSVTDLPAEPGHDIVSSETFEVTTNFPLASADAAQVTAGQNRFCLGGEVGQFETATLLGMVGTLYHYELSGLRRAKYGTAADAWLAGARFVLLDQSVAFVQAQRNMIGVDLYYKAVSFGHTSDDTTAVAYLFEDPASQTEWTPDSVAAARNGVSNDVEVTWAGRPRLGQFGTPFHSKYFRGYRVKFSDSHTIDTTAQTVTYAAAPAGLTVQVCALNEITGEGPWSAPVAT